MTQSVIGALRVNLGLDTARFRSGAREAQGIADRLGRQMQRIGAAMSAVGAGLALAIRGQVQAADDLQKAADRVGVPVEAFSQLAHAASLGGASLEHLETGLRGLSERMIRQPQLFAAMGIAVRDAEGNIRPTVDVLADVADRLQALPPGAERTEAAMRLMGEAGMRLIPTLQGGSAGLRAMMAEADRLGLTLDERTGRAAEAFNDNMARLGQVAVGLARQIAAALLPVLVQITAAMQRVAEGFARLSPTMQTFAAAMSVLVVAGGPVLILLGTLIRSLGALRVALAAAAGPWGALAALIAAAAGYFLTFGTNAGVARTAADETAAAQAALNEAMGVFYQTASPSSATAAITAANAYREQAAAARDAAASELALLEAEAARFAAAPLEERGLLGDMTDRNNQNDILAARVELDRARAALIEAQVAAERATRAVTGAMSEQITTAQSLTAATGELTISIEGVDVAAGGAAQGIDEVVDATDSAQSRIASMAQGLTSVFMAARNGADAARQAAMRLLDQVLEMVLNNAFQGLLGRAFGGNSILGNIFAGAFGGGPVAAAGPVAARSAGAPVAVNVNNYSGQSVETRETSGPNGERQIDVMIGQSFGRGRQDGVMGRFGVKPQPVRR